MTKLFHHLQCSGAIQPVIPYLVSGTFFQAYFTLLKMLVFCTKYCLGVWGKVVDVRIFLICIISKEVDYLSS